MRAAAHRYRVAAVLMAVAATTAVTPASARPAVEPAAAASCPSKDVKVLNENRYVIVYRFVAGRHKNESESCVKATHRRTLLDYGEPQDVLGVPRPALDRYTVAYDVEEQSAEDAFETLMVFDARGVKLSDGSALRQIDPRIAPGLVTRLAVRASGGLAWSLSSRSQARIYRQQADEDEPRLLARGPRVDPRSLHLVRGKIEWRDGRKRRRALLE